MLDLLIGTAWAQDGAAPAGGGGSQMLFFFASIIGIWYFLVIRPQTKQQKAHADMVAALKKGDSVVAAGGIHGKVHEVQEDALLIEVSKGVRLKIDKNKVARRNDGVDDKTDSGS
jgi:preprotein translocase subunit YajC